MKIALAARTPEPQFVWQVTGHGRRTITTHLTWWRWLRAVLGGISDSLRLGGPWTDGRGVNPRGATRDLLVHLSGDESGSLVLRGWEPGRARVHPRITRMASSTGNCWDLAEELRRSSADQTHEVGSIKSFADVQQVVQRETSTDGTAEDR